MALYIRDLLSILHTGFLVLDFYGVLVQLSVFTHDSYRDLTSYTTHTSASRLKASLLAIALAREHKVALILASSVLEMTDVLIIDLATNYQMRWSIHRPAPPVLPAQRLVPKCSQLTAV